MIHSEKYWILHGINSFGHYQSKEILEAKSFFLEQFEQAIAENQIKERQIQLQLFNWYTCGQTQIKLKAKLCLECFVSQCIYWFCLSAEQKYQENYGLSKNDLFPVVLTSIQPIKYHNSKKPVSLIQDIINSFQQERNSSLSTWTKIKVKGNKQYKKILKSYGIVEVTDWLILVKATIGNLERKLKQRGYSDREIERYCYLLEAFHKVYGTDLFIKREKINKYRVESGKPRINKPYPIPKEEQLNKIARIVCDLTSQLLESQIILLQLKEIARILRSNPPVNNFLVNDRQREVLEDRTISIVQDKIEENLSIIINQVINTRINYFVQGSKSQKAKANKLIESLFLFHCQQLSMKEIASILDLKDRSKVSRLLKLKELRKDVYQQLVSSSSLQDSLTQQFTSWIPESRNLLDLEQKIQNFLESEIQKIVDDAAKEALNSQNRNRNSLFSRTVCECVKQIRIN